MESLPKFRGLVAVLRIPLSQACTRTWPMLCSGLALVGFWLALGQNLQGKEPTSDDLEYFEKSIRPLLVTHCYECHGPTGKAQGNLRLTGADGWSTGGDSGPAIVPGDLKGSLFLQAIRYENLEMPPQGKLPPEVVRVFEQWVQRGAPAPKGTGNVEKKELDLVSGRQFWSYRPIQTSQTPQVNDTLWPLNSFDAYILNQLESADLAPQPAVPKGTLIRRLYFDLLGLPPSEEELADALADMSPVAHHRLVDRLLASPHYGERWGRHWLDVVRFGESLTLRGFILTEAWRYRDHVIKTFNEDGSIADFIRRQIAGDQLPADSLQQQQEQLIATTFLTLGNTNLEEQDKRQLDMDVVDEQLDTLGKAILGQTLGCARCHDHKFDPIPTRDYYAMAGILRNSQMMEHANVSKWIEVPLPQPPELEAVFVAHENQVKELENQIKKLKKTMATAAKGEPVAPRNRFALDELAGIVVDDQQAKRVGDWVHSKQIGPYIGEGYLHDDAQGKGEKTITFVASIPSDGHYEVRLAYAAGASRAVNTPVTIFSPGGEQVIYVDQTQPPPIDSRFISLGEHWFEKSGQSFVIVSTEGTTGHVTADAVQWLPAGTESSLRSKPAGPLAAGPSKERGAEQADQQKELKEMERMLKSIQDSGRKRPMAMTVRDRPECTDCPIHIRGSVHSLGATVPRGFLQVIGEQTPAKFDGNSSGRKELAQWLVSQRNPLTPRVFANRVWQGLFGEGIVRTPDNFGTTGDMPSHPELLDAISIHLVDTGWSVKHLTRELVFSQTYQQSSQEIVETGGRLHDPQNRLLWRMNRKRLEAEAIRDAALVVAGNLDRTLFGSSIPPGTTVDYNFKHSGTRRSLYLPVFRNALPDIFEAFDFGDPSLVVGRRNVSTVAPQALFLLNHPFLREQARMAAKRILAETESARPPLDRAFLITLGRGPAEAEREIAEAWLSRSEETPSKETDQFHRWTELIHSLLSSLDFRYRD